MHRTAERQFLGEEQRTKPLPRRRNWNQQRKNTTQNGMRVIAHARVTNGVQYMDMALPGNSTGPGVSIFQRTSGEGTPPVTFEQLLMLM